MSGTDWIWVLCFVFVIVVMIPVISWQMPGFRRERRYLQMEINRTDGKERRRWKKRLRKLYLHRLFPFIRY